ncbi:hypothetical protein ASD11_08210 [Aeromicrobium sp. Root495]|uniref:hypothetical protein n=1 Tax=Aeromicrobium sp. Root495 TaxID=1736550 RepID=UPI0007005778|nr:hypothetical protein [Aeromicrobium sp. Root495]KQY59533.1 hypothetical protein ASD11_08210 [Aeromicrobium sp. Root495]
MPAARLPRIALALASAVLVGVLVVLVVSRVSATQKPPEGDFAPVVVPGTAGTATPGPTASAEPTARPSATAPVQATPTPRTIDDDDDDDDDEPDDPDDRFDD